MNLVDFDKLMLVLIGFPGDVDDLLCPLSEVVNNPNEDPNLNDSKTTKDNSISHNTIDNINNNLSSHEDDEVIETLQTTPTAS